MFMLAQSLRVVARDPAYLPIVLTLFMVLVWISAISPTLSPHLLPLISPGLDDPCTGAPIPC